MLDVSVNKPDPHYVDKLRDVRVNLLGVQPGVAFVFQDEFTFYRQPRVARAYKLAGKTQPWAERGLKSNAAWRIAAPLNGGTGQVTYLEGSRIAIPRLVELYQKVAAAGPDAAVIKLARPFSP